MWIIRHGKPSGQKDGNGAEALGLVLVPGDRKTVDAGEGDGGEHGVVDGAEGGKVLFEGGEGEDADCGAAAGVDAMIVDGLAVLGAVADFEGNGFGGAGDGWRRSGVDFRFA